MNLDKIVKTNDKEILNCQQNNTYCQPTEKGLIYCTYINGHHCPHYLKIKNNTLCTKNSIIEENKDDDNNQNLCALL